MGKYVKLISVFITLLVIVSGTVWTTGETFARKDDVVALDKAVRSQMMTQQEILSAFENLNKKLDYEVKSAKVSFLRAELRRLKEAKYDVRRKLLEDPNNNDLKLRLEQLLDYISDTEKSLERLR